VNLFESQPRYDLEEVREALGVVDRVPVLDCDARERESVKDVLVALTEEVLSRRLQREDPMVTR
jgi:signal recognition particle receptor subunit beta